MIHQQHLLIAIRQMGSSLHFSYAGLSGLSVEHNKPYDQPKIIGFP